MILGVTITMSSIVDRFKFFERNSCPRMGMSAIPGTLLRLSVVRLSRMPEIPEAFAVFQLHLGFGPACRQGRQNISRDDHLVGVIQRADLLAPP